MNLEKILRAGKKILVGGLIASSLFFGCKKEEVAPDQESNKIVLADNVKILTNQNLQTISYYNYFTIKFNQSTNSPVLNIGDIIVGGISDKDTLGILAKVNNVYDNGYSADLEKASLSEAIVSGKINFTKTLKPEDLKPSQKNKLKNSNLNYDFNYNFLNEVLYDFDGNTNTTNDQIRISGKMYFNIGMDLNIDISKETINFKTTLEDLARVQLDAEFTGQNINEYKQFISYNFAPIVFFLPTEPPFPIVINPWVGIGASIEGETNAEANFAAEQSNTFSLGVNYENGWSVSKSFSSNFNVETPEAYLNTNLKAYLTLGMGAYLYGFAGPHADINPYLRLNVNTNNNPWLSLYGGITGSVGMHVSLIGFGSDYYEKNIIDYEKLLLELYNNPPGGNTFTDPRDGKVYDIVEIGNQTWFAKNLNYNSSGSYCYNNNSTNCDLYGRLYNWDKAKIVCPSGWHLPSDGEFQTLEMFLGMSAAEANSIAPNRGAAQNVGTKLKEGGSSGFDALMAGHRTSTGNYMNFGEYGYFWTSTMNTTDYPMNRTLYQNSTGVSRDDYIIKDAYFSVRCLKDSK